MGSHRTRRIRIQRFFETHRNEDYVVRSRELFRIATAGIFRGPEIPRLTTTRSSCAASMLLKAGRRRVYNLIGGIDAGKKLRCLLVRDYNSKFINHGTKLNTCFPSV